MKATNAKPAISSTVHQLRRLLPPNGLIEMADSDSSRINRRQLDATTRTIRKQKRFPRLAGPRCPIFLCEFLIIFDDYSFSGEFRTTVLSDWTMERCCYSAESIGEVEELSKLEFGN
jgi:hypothetical protein